MKKRVIIGREKEQAELQRCLESSQSELVIVYGRRRVGKTYLVDVFFQNRFDFTFVGGHGLPLKLQLRNFAKELKRISGAASMPNFADWFEAFDALEDYLASLPADRKKVVFIDEMPWIDSLRSNFTQAFENFWNGWAARRQDILFVASGSATSWMMDNLVENQGGLHARITSRICLRPFSLHETEQYLQSRGSQWDRFQMAQCYMFLGGIPFYLSLLNTRLSLAQNIDALCFDPAGALRSEFNELYNALFSNADDYITVVRYLAAHRGGITYASISAATKLEGGLLTKILTNLERCDFIMKFRYYGQKKQLTLFRLCDFFTLFFLKYVEPNRDAYDAQWWSHHTNSHSVEAWQGITFELLCLVHINQIRKALGISGVASDVSAWFDKKQSHTSEESTARQSSGAQIDLIIERADRIINLCEMKFSQGPYIISADYESRLRERREIFRDRTQTKKSLVNTLITTFGIANNSHAGVADAQVTLSELFC